MIDADYLKQTFGLTQRTALITGGGRGIGLAIAEALGRAGARVVINDINPDTCAQAVQRLSDIGIQARSAVFDVARLEAVEAAFDRLGADGWNVDILISNAGNQNRKPLVEMTAAEWQSLMNVHVNGAFNCARTALPGMTSRGFGRVVITGSVSGFATMPNIAAYSTAKAALAALARAIGVEYGAFGITANAIAPGFVRTDFTEALQKRPDFDERIRNSVPSGRWATTDDIAPTVLFLVSPAASFINGQTLTIDGGMLALL
jgi:gluconate 5-dehydrogenase